MTDLLVSAEPLIQRTRVELDRELAASIPASLQGYFTRQEQGNHPSLNHHPSMQTLNRSVDRRCRLLIIPLSLKSYVVLVMTSFEFVDCMDLVTCGERRYLHNVSTMYDHQETHHEVLEWSPFIESDNRPSNSISFEMAR